MLVERILEDFEVYWSMRRLASFAGNDRSEYKVCKGYDPRIFLNASNS